MPTGQVAIDAASCHLNEPAVQVVQPAAVVHMPQVPVEQVAAHDVPPGWTSRHELHCWQVVVDVQVAQPFMQAVHAVPLA